METTLCIATIVLLFSLSAHAQEKDPVKRANAVNEDKVDEKKIIDKDVADFLVKSADARMMDAKEGRLAKENATIAALREYGELMIKDQSLILDKIKSLAGKRNITLPTGISEKKEDGREDLSTEKGKDFDDKFIKMMIKDHKRDIKLFTKATECKDKEVSDFAKKYLPVIQSHLDKINEIKSSIK